MALPSSHSRPSRPLPRGLVLLSALCTAWVALHLARQGRTTAALLAELAAARGGLAGPAQALSGGDSFSEVLRLQAALAAQGAQLSRAEARLKAERTRTVTLDAAKLNGAVPSKLLALVAVSSHPARRELRAAVRRAWAPNGTAPQAALEREHGLVLRFVLGRAPPQLAAANFSAADAARLGKLRAAALQAEQEQFGDLLFVEVRRVASPCWPWPLPGWC